MDPNALIQQVAIIVEECCESHYETGTGNREPLTRAELVAIRERIETLVALNMPRESDELQPEAT